VIHIAVNAKYAGYIIISDELKTDSETAILSLKKLGVEKTIILTGDNEVATKELADKLGIETYYTGLLPEDKVAHLEKILIQNKNSKVAFVGDGINDAPVLARADVGIAMGGLGSDAGIEAADIVIMEDQPSKVAVAIEVAQKTRHVVWQNIFLALGIKGFFIIMGSLGAASMWEAVFADMGVAILAILNASRMLKFE
jgi:Cd2+/Zn2+-exporting ATPase